MTERDVSGAVARQPWPAIEQSLDANGNAVLRGLLTPAQCGQIARLYDCHELFRSKVVMARHRFGKGEYKYFAYPLPPLLNELRYALYSRLAQVANRWNSRLGNPIEFPATLEAFLHRCHEAGQLRPTPLLLRYESGDYNRLHQDLYGEHVFPLQATILLSRPDADFEGGEFVMTETGPTSRRADVVSLAQGDAVVFTVNQRPAAGTQGRPRRVAMHHGVSQVHGGQRFTVGLIFHDAR